LTKITSTKQQLTIAIAGKYTNVPDSYLSVIESLKFAGYELKVKVKLQLIDSTTLTKENVDQLLKTADGILIPGGFGNRGVEGKKIAIQYARENKVPVFGICFGMQLMCIEFAANVCKLENVNSEEMEPNAKSLLFTIFPDYQMQLGNRKLIIINDQSIAFKLYQQQTIEERHRHRYELNPEFIEILTQNGLIISAILQSKEKAQFASIIELTEHPFFIGTQFHPEFIS
jgi:CTP synthase